MSVIALPLDLSYALLSIHPLRIICNRTQLLLSSDVGVVIIEDDKLTAAQQIIAELKGETA